MRESDFLQLNGIQHYEFCPRQWAIINIEQEWRENGRTMDGQILHERVHNELVTEKRGDILTVRALPVSSARLGISGECDVVEFHRCANGVSLHGWNGLWQPYPVEYKKGQPKANLSDEMQLCCQAICLEEMLVCSISAGALFYGEPRRRTVVEFSQGLREHTESTVRKMHELFKRGVVPKVKQKGNCQACSLKDICLPKLKRVPTVKAYLESYFKGDKSDETSS